MEPAPDINRGKEFLDKAKEIHAKYPLFDGHNGEEIDGKGGDRSQESPMPIMYCRLAGGGTTAGQLRRLFTPRLTIVLYAPSTPSTPLRSTLGYSKWFRHEAQQHRPDQGPEGHEG